MTNEEMHEYGEYYYGVYGDIYAKLNGSRNGADLYLQVCPMK